MSETEPQDDAPKKKGGSAMLLISIVVALLLGGGAGAAIFFGVVPIGGGEKSDHGESHGGSGAAATDDHGGSKKGRGAKGASKTSYHVDHAGDVAFVTLDPLIISLGPEASARHLKLTISLETSTDATEGVEVMTPRILDVLNTYLRAVEVRDLEDPSAMARLRAQMTRRVQMVTPPESVRDVLILEFVLN